jgi:predicted dehydrogenase
MSTQIVIGLVGTGDIGRVHARALRQRSDVELRVAGGTNYEKGVIFAREFGVRLYSDYGAMLRDESIQGVDICVPNHLHRVYVEQAASAGKAILCEKPIAMTLEDAEAMRAAAGRADAKLFIAHPLRFWSEYCVMRRELLSNSLGACRAITLRRMLSLHVSVSGEQGWRHDPERMGGAILDLQIHDLDFLYWTFGLPDTVYCAAARSEDGGLNHVYATFAYRDGPVAMVESSYLLQGDPMVFTAKAVCEHGSLDYGLNLQQFGMHNIAGSGGHTVTESPTSLVCYRPNCEPRPLVFQEPDLLNAVFARELSYFVDCVSGRAAENLLPIEDSIAALRMALACRESVVSGRIIELPHENHATRNHPVEY